jgi:Flp pilus assembly protein TadD
MAHILAKNGNDPQCEIVLRKLIDTHPDFAPAYNELAELFMRHDRSDEAVGVLEAGVAAVPGDSVLWNNLGMVHLLRDELDGARDSFTHACAAAPSDARPRANLAVSLAMSGRLEEAEAVYLQATTRARAYHDLAVLCEARGDMENAKLYHELSEGKRPSRKTGS